MGLSFCDVWLLSALSGSPAAGHELQPCPQSHRGAGTCWFLCSGFCPPKKEPLGSPQWHLCHPECPGRAQRQPLIARECEPHALFMPHPSRNQQGWRGLRKFSIKKGKLSRIVGVLTSHWGGICCPPELPSASSVPRVMLGTSRTRWCKCQRGNLCRDCWWHCEAPLPSHCYK